MASLRLTLKICATFEILRNKAKFWVNSVNVAIWVQGQRRNFQQFVSQRVGENHDESSPDQWRHVQTKLNPADQETRGAFVPELGTDNPGIKPQFYNVEKMSGQKRNLEKRQKLTRKSQKQRQFEKNEPSNSAKSSCEEGVKPNGETDTKDYSKCYRIQSK